MSSFSRKPKSGKT